MISIDVETNNYGLEHSIKKMDDSIGEARALDFENVVKDYIIQNHEYELSMKTLEERGEV